MLRNIKLDIAFITATILGYLYISGRLYLDGSAAASGTSAPLLGYEFTDYTYQGFLSNLDVLRYFIIFFAIYFFIKRASTKKIYLIINFKILARILKNYLASIPIDKNLIKIQIIREDIKHRKIRRHKKENMFDFLYYNFFLSYTFLVIGLYCLLAFLLNFSNFYSQGAEASLATTLRSDTYIKNNDEKLYPVTCAKEKCIFSNKKYDLFYIAKKDEIITYKETPINSYSSKYSISSYVINMKSERKLTKVNIQTNISNKNDPFIHFYNVKLVTKTPKFNTKIYETINTKEINSLNSKYFKYEKNIPYFSYFEIPQNETILYISLEPSNEIY